MSDTESIRSIFSLSINTYQYSYHITPTRYILSIPFNIYTQCGSRIVFRFCCVYLWYLTHLAAICCSASRVYFRPKLLLVALHCICVRSARPRHCIVVPQTSRHHHGGWGVVRSLSIQGCALLSFAVRLPDSRLADGRPLLTLSHHLS